MAFGAREPADPRRGALPGGHTETFRATELSDADKIEVLRAYLRRWKMEVGVFFDGVSAESPDEELARIAPRHPVFRVEGPAAAA
jgi:hypothetical protein